MNHCRRCDTPIPDGYTLCPVCIMEMTMSDAHSDQVTIKPTFDTPYYRRDKEVNK